jgi:hypothetical protein
MREEVHNAVIRVRKGIQIPANKLHRGNTLVGSMDDEAYVLAVSKVPGGVIVSTGVGKIAYANSEMVSIDDGDLFTGVIGCEVDYFIENLVDYASANDELECHINGYLFVVNSSDTVETVMKKYNQSQEDVKNGISKIYHLA